ncbi:MAG: ABC transporter substrate-binding protein [Spirochaetota bacterium]
MRQLFISTILLISMTLPVFAGGNQEKELEEINVSYVKSPFNLPSIVMKERGMLERAFAERGIEVRYHEITSGAKQAQAMAAGSLDIGGVMNTTSVLLAHNAGNDVRIISGYSRPVKIFSIVSGNREIQNIADLKGSKVAGPKGTVLHQLLLSALESEGMSIRDIEFLQMGLPQASTAMIAGQIDAALLAGSLVINAQKQGAHILTTAEGYVTPKLVIAARGKFLDTHPEAVHLYLETHKSAMEWVEQNLEEALRIGAEEQGISLQEARRLYEWTQFIDALTAQDIETMRDDIRFMLHTNMISEQFNPEACFAEFALP